ncbi:MAG: hypothetical protein MR487_05985 [Lachnospiraceae bacterium]|nr:hypothetical protein [Lachnospiraceae bacterium]
MKSILHTSKEYCFYCGAICQTEEHHIFYGTANRRLSEKYGLKVYLCIRHHRVYPESVHGGNRDLDRILKEAGQKAFEKRFGNREEFRKIFGKNYLEDENGND